MKKITLTVAAALFTASLFSQDKLFTEVEKKYLTKDIKNAKQLIDQAIANPQYTNSAEFWLWKSTLDAVVAQDEKLNASCPTCIQTSYEAFKKYEALEPNYKLLSEIPFSWKPLGILYNDNYNKGAKAFKEKDYENAFAGFDRCVEMTKIMMARDLRQNGGALDTIPFLYAGYSAQNAKKIPEAVKYLTFLADKKYAVKEDAEMYKLLLTDFIDLKDKANFDKYLAIAQEIFPTEDYKAYKLEYMNRNSNLDEKLKVYSEEDAKNTLNGDDYIYFGSMFSQHSKEEKETLDKDITRKLMIHGKAREAFAKAYKLTNNELMAYNVGLLYYTEYSAYDDMQRDNVKKLQEINATKTVEKDPKKKAAADAKIKEQTEPIKKANAELEVKMIDITNNSIEWFEKTVTLLKDKADKSKVEKTSLKNAVNNLTNLFNYRMDKARGKDVKAFDAAEAKFKYYDDMYNKL